MFRRAFFHSILISGLASSFAAPAFADQEDFCDDTKTHVQINAGFEINPILTSAFGGMARLNCNQTDPIKSVEAQLIDALAQQSIQVDAADISYNDTGVINISLETDQDQDLRSSVLMPLVFAERSEDVLNKIIGDIRIKGDMIENETVKVTFPVDMNALKSMRARLKLNWLRDGQIIAGATRSRYQLAEKDIGRRISVQVTIIDLDQKQVLKRESAATIQVAMADHPPEIRDLKLIGEPILGREIRAEFQTFDKNVEDQDTGAEIIWLRDNLAIPGATGPVYTLTEDDLGHVIRAMVTPRTSRDGGGKIVSGDIAMMALPNPIEKQLIVLAPEKKQAEPKEEKKETTSEQVAQQMSAEDKTPEQKSETKLDDASEQVTVETETVTEQDSTITAPPPRPVVIQTENETPETSPKIDVKPALDAAPTIPPSEKLKPEEKLVALAEGLSLVEGDLTALKKITFTDTGLIRQIELDAVNRKYRGREFSIDLVREILEDINALYVEKGYELSRALLPQQIIRNGMLRIQLVDAKVGAVIVENAERLNEEYILNRIGFKQGDDISLAALENKIRIFNANNKTQLTTELSPGQNFGETDVFVKVTEPGLIELPTVSINNHGSEISDWKQNSFTTKFNNLMGLDDEFSVSISDAEGSKSRAFALSFPLGKGGTNISLSRSDADTKVKNGPDATVGFRGQSNSTSIGISTPIIFNDEYSIYLSAAYARAYGDLVQPGDGAVLSESRTRKLALSLPASWSNGLTTVSISPTFSVLNTVTEIPPSENWMSKFETEFSISQFITPGLTFNGRGKYLETDAREMINMPSEILTVGGPGSVRGYQPSEDSGYRGYFASAELRGEMATWDGVSLPSFIPSIQPNIFIDHMFAQSQFRRKTRADYWSSVGVGLTVPSVFDMFTFDAYYARPLDGAIHQAEKDAYSSNVLKFSISAQVNIN